MQENSIMTISDFNISTITPEAAAALETHNAIISSLENAANALVSLCRNLKHMRDTKGFTALGFEKFEDYTENACNIKKRQAYNYIQSYERLGSDFMQSNAQLGITKLLLLTEVCAVDRADFVEENDLEGIEISKKANNTNINLNWTEFNSEYSSRIKNDGKNTKINEWYVTRSWEKEVRGGEYWGT